MSESARIPAGRSHSGRRRHAAPSDTTWVRRAGLVGGVVSALALTGAAAPALATSNGSGSDTVRDAASTTSAVSSLTATSSAQQAAAAFEQGAIDAKLAAEKQQAATAAKKSAAAAKKAAQEKAAKAAAALKAAREKAAAEAAAEPTSSASSSSTASSSSASSASTASTTVAPASSSKVDQLIAFLKSQLGKPYVYGATGPDSYDCSGLTQVAFSSVGVSIPRTSEEQSTVGTPVGISDLQPGDLIFWGGEGSAYHVGVFIGDGQYLDAANSSTPVAIHQLADYMPDWAVRVL